METLNKDLIKAPCSPHPNINLLLENKPQLPKTVAFSEQTKDEELEEELKDNISHLDFMHSSRKPSYMTNKNPYSLLQQPILKRFSNNQLIRDSLSPRVSAKGKSESFSLQRASDYGAKLSENQYPSPRQHFSVDEYTTRNKSKSNKTEKIEKISEIDDNNSYSIYEGKSRNSLITNIDDYLRSFSAKSLSNKEKTTKNAEEEEIGGTFQENLLRNINDEQNELAKEERKVLYDYLMDFMVISLDDNNEEDLENNFLLDEEGEKMLKELNDIPGLHKKLKITTGMKECAFLQVAKMNELEKIKIDFELYPDDFPLLSLRKNLLLLTRGISLLCKMIVTSKTFEILSLIIIMLNSLSYSMRNNRSNQYEQYLKYFEWAEDFFLFYYSTEILLKVLAFGIIYYKESFFRDGWNILDFIVVLGLYLSYTSVKDLNLSLLRLLRLLRPLKTSSAFKGLGIILYSLFSALPLLIISFLVLNFFYSVFAICGLQVFSGILKLRCFEEATGLVTDNICGNQLCKEGFICGKGIANPYENVINFDNLFSAYLMTLLTVTLDNWTTIMYFVLRAYSNYAWIYHVTLAIFGNYFLLNLLLAVIKVKFGESHQSLFIENETDKAKSKSTHYFDLADIKREGIWEGRKVVPIVRVPIHNIKGWTRSFYEMLKFYFFDKFKLKARILPKNKRRRASESPKLAKNFRNFFDFENAKKRSTLATLNQYTTKMLGYFIVKDKNLIKKKSSNIDKNTNPRYLKLRVNHQKEYEALSKDEVLYKKFLKCKKEEENLESLEKKQKIIYSMKKNKNYFLDLLRELNKNDQNAVKPFEKGNIPDFLLRQKTSKKPSQKPSQRNSPTSKRPNEHTSQESFLTSAKNHEKSRFKEPKNKEKTNVPLIPSSRMRNSALMKVKMSTQIDDNEAYVLTFKSSPSSKSHSRTFSKQSQTHTYSVIGHSNSRIIDNSKSTLGGFIYKIKGKIFKQSDPEYLFVKASINSPIDHEELPEKEKYVEENMNYMQKYISLLLPAKNEGGFIGFTWSAQDILRNYELDKFEKILDELNLHKLEQYVEELKFKYRRFRKKVNSFMRYSFTQKFFLLNLISYLFLLAMIGILEDDLIYNLDIMYNAIFTIEITLKLLGFGIKTSFKDYSNIVDIVVVILSYLAMIFEALIGIDAEYYRFIYTFKVLRAFRFFNKIKFIQTLLTVFSKSLSSFVYLLFLLIMFNFVYALIGMQLFGGSFDESDFRYSKYNFDTFWLSFVTTFNIITLDNWIDIVALGFKSNAGLYVTGAFAISWIFLGNFVLLNLFLAILLDSVTQNFSENEVISNKEEENEEQSNQASLKVQNSLNKCLTIFPSNKFIVNKEAGEKIMDELSKLKGEKAREFANSINIDKFKKKIKSGSPSPQQKRRSSYRAAFIQTKSLEHIYCENSLFIFSKNNKLRIISYKIVTSSFLEKFMNLVIIASSLVLIIETYIDFNSEDSVEIFLRIFCATVNIILAVIYSLEILLKGITYGLIFDRRSYLRNAWNFLDFILTVCYVSDTFTPEDSDSVIIKAIKVLKVFRPIKIIIINPNIRIAVNSLLKSAYSIVNVLIFILIVWLIFAILGTILFRDRFGYCETQTNFDVNKQNCLDSNLSWKIYKSNFNTFLDSFLTLFVISTLDGWCDVMSVATNCDIEEKGPHKFNNEYSSYSYFLIFILFGTMFLTNLFISVIFMDFLQEQKRLKNKFLTDSQVAWMNIQSLIVESKPDFQYNRPPAQKIRRFFFYLFMHWTVKLLFNIFIMLDILALSAYYDDSHIEYRDNLDLIHLLFNLFFLTEFILKLFGKGFNGYFHDVWNRFEFFIVLTIFIDISVFALYQELFLSVNYLVRIVRGLRSLKILRLLKTFYKVKSVQKLLQTLKLSLPMVLNIFALLMLIYYIYVIFGCIYFKHITSGDTIDDYINFKNFSYGLMTLFKVSTADGWEGIMYDIMEYHNWSWFYFVSFYIITTEIMINLFILVLLNQFDEYSSNSENPMHTFKENLEQFRKGWSIYTVKHKGKKMHKKHILSFFKAMRPPLGYHGIDEELEYIYKDITQMNLKTDSLGFLYFNEVLFGAMKKAYHDQIIENSNDLTKKKIEHMERKTLAKLNYLQKTNKSYRLKKSKSAVSEVFDETASFIFNPLCKHLFGKLAFNVWQKYSESLLERILRCEYDNIPYFEENSSGEDNKEEIIDIIDESQTIQNKHFVSYNETPPNTKSIYKKVL